MKKQEPKVFDMIGIGYGPAHIALNICLKECKKNTTYNSLFLEKKKNFVWHEGLLLPNTYMQISFLKDIATLRNPNSKYTFINYLFEQNRLNEFINLNQTQPSRAEFNDYLSWAAQKSSQNVTYNRFVKQVLPIVNPNTGNVELLKVIAYAQEKGRNHTFYAKNLSVALGSIPNKLMLGTLNQVIHSAEFLHKIKTLKKDKAYRFVVVGSGQSAIEMLLHLYHNFPNAQIDTVLRKFAYNSVASSPFVNEIFDNKQVDSHYFGNNYVKEHLFIKPTNYGVCDEKELSELYGIMYHQKCTNNNRISIKNFTTVVGGKQMGEGVELRLEDMEKEVSYTQQYDAVFLGTGFRKHSLNLLDKLRPYCVEKNGELFANRDYSVRTKTDFQPKVFLLGHSEAQHGIGNTLLSNIAERAEELRKALEKHLATQTTYRKSSSFLDISKNMPLTDSARL